MLRIGLTGGIGSGKSTVGRMLKTHGLQVFDADAIGRALLDENSPLTQNIQSQFPGCGSDEGGINRSQLAAKVFADPKARSWLENQMHPAILNEIKAREARLPSQTQTVVLEGAVLLESQTPFDLQGMIVVWAPEKTRLARAMARDEVIEDRIRDRMVAQLPEADKLQAATHFIDNGGPLQATREQVSRLAHSLKIEAGGEDES
ncbi:MAG: dephospho-CoA kinase [Deltaproteobacteria bacterium]|nr:dephospho-CoA kinase [Deltaproteobacteria bacterium]